MLPFSVGPQAERSARLLEREGDLLAPLTRTYADPLAISRTRAQQASGVQRQNEFLQDLVRRLQAELRLFQEKYSDVFSDREVQSKNDGQSLPPWIAEPEHFSPLLTAYDMRINELESLLRTAQDDMASIQSRAKAIVNENERLLAEVKFWTEEAKKRAEHDESLASPLVGTGPVGMDFAFESEERIRLLQAENETLDEMHRFAQQQLKAAQEEIQKIKNTLRTDTSPSKHVSQLSADRETWNRERKQLQQQIDTLQRENQELFRLSSTRGGATAGNNASLIQHQQQASNERLTAVRQLVEEERDRLERDNEDLKRSLAELQISYRAAQHQANLYQQEAEQYREKHTISTQRMNTMRQEADDVSRVVEKLEKDVEGYKSRELKLQQQLKHQMHVNEAAKLAVDTAETKENRCKEEIQRLEERLKNVLTDGQKHNQETIKIMQNKMKTQISVLKEEVSRLDAKCVDLREQAERAQREQKSVETEMEKLLRDGPGGQLARLEAEVHSLSLQLQHAEKERDAATQFADSLKLSIRKQQAALEQQRTSEMAKLADAQRMSRNLELQVTELSEENKQLHMTITDIKTQFRTAQKESEWEQQSRYEEAMFTIQQYQSKVNDLEQRIVQAGKNEDDAQQQLQQMLEAHETLKQKWKEMSQSLAAKSAKQVEELQEELDRMRSRNDQLSEQLTVAMDSGATRQLEEYAMTIQKLKNLLHSAEQRSANATQQVSELLVNEARLANDKKSIAAQLDKLVFAQKDSDRQLQREKLNNQRLKQELDQAQEEINSLLRKSQSAKPKRRSSSREAREIDTSES